MTKLSFRMNEQDVIDGDPESASMCPVSLCIKRSIPGCEAISDGGVIVINNVEYATPQLVAQFIQDYDSGIHGHLEPNIIHIT